MRKRKWKQGIAVLTAAALVLTGITVPGSAGAKAKIRLNKKKVTIKVGGKVTLKLKNAKKKVIWKSSKKKVASVSAKGIVRGKSAGTAKITAKSNKKSYTCTQNSIMFESVNRCIPKVLLQMMQYRWG